MSYWNESIASTLRPLKHYCVVNPDILPEDTAPGWEFDYIDIGSVSLSQGVIKKERLRFENAPSRARKPVKSGDILVSTVRTYLKAIAAVQADETAQVASTGFAVLRANQLSDPRFLFRVVQSNPFVEQVVSQSVGVSYPAINPSTLANIKIPLPDLATQRRIADFLDRETARLDLLIEKKQRLVAVLGERRSRFVYSFLMGDNLSNSRRTSTKNTWFPIIPSGWRLARLKAVVNHISDGPHISPNYVDEGIPFISARNIRADRWLLSSAKYISVELFNELSRKSCPKVGDVLYTKGGTTGVARMVDLDFDFQIWVHVALLKVRKELIEPQYLAAALNSLGCYEQAQLYTRGATNKDLGLNRMANIWLPLPPLNEQADIIKEFTQRFSKIDPSHLLATQSIARLKEYRSALITAAVTGQIDVATYARTGSTDRRLDSIEQEAGA